MSTESDFVDSGPFCRHWSDPTDCEIACANCTHLCGAHDQMEEGSCSADACECPGWKEPPSP
jgi:hypothetical protein